MSDTPTPSTDAALACYPEDYKLVLNGDNLVPAKLCREWEKVARKLAPFVRHAIGCNPDAGCDCGAQAAITFPSTGRTCHGHETA